MASLVRLFSRRPNCCHRKVRREPLRIHHLIGYRARSASTLITRYDKYRGVHVDLANLAEGCTPEHFESLLVEALDQWRSTGCTAAWLRVPIAQSHLINAAAKHGFSFHNAEHDQSHLCIWLNKDTSSRLPQFATHQVGVAGLVIKENTQEILVVKDKMRPYNLWKFPGGLSHLGEDIADTAEREILEETGVITNFQGILCFRQQHNQFGAFGRSDLFFICHMTPVTVELTPCSWEIEACQWMSLDELEKTMQTSAITQRVIQLTKVGLKDGFDQVHLDREEFRSIYKGLKFKVYSRPLPEEYKLESYQHSIVDSKEDASKL